jgi:hypothetical protein
VITIMTSSIMLFCSCSYATICGGRDERIGAAGFAIAAVLSAYLSAPATSFFTEIEIGILLTDCLLLIVLTWLLIVSKAYWPIWATGFHLVSVVTHIARWAQPDIVPVAYATYGEFWAYPVLASLIWGTRHYQWLRTMAPA